jgi:ribonuclease P protein component
VRATFVPAPADQPGLFPQVGYAIGRNCGNAVTRNTLRRRMRAIVQSSASSLPRGTYLLRAEATATEVPPADLAGHVQAALAQAAGSGGRS